MVAVVVVEEVCRQTAAAVVRSVTEQAQPVGAVALLPMVMMSVQVAVAPLENFPAVAPPALAESVQPLFVVNVTPIEIVPLSERVAAAVATLVLTTLMPVVDSLKQKTQIPVARSPKPI